MIQLFYVSNTSFKFKGKEDIEDILAKAHSYNNTNNISGVLLYHSGIFLQLLEGDKAEVDSLFAKIFKDPRHSNITTFFEIEAKERIFSSWGMAYKEVDALDIKVVNQMLAWNRVLQRAKDIDHKLIINMLEQFKSRISPEELPNLNI